MPFSVKNGPLIYQKTITKPFCEYIDVFMKIFLGDFIVFSDLSTRFLKLNKCFLKCREFGINLNPYKCAFMVFSRTVIGFIMLKIIIIIINMDLKKVEASINVSIPTTPRRYMCLMGLRSSIGVLLKKIASIMSPIMTKLLKFIPFEMDFQDIIRCQLHPKNQHKITFVTKLGAFVWVVMPFGVKNGLPTYQNVVTKEFREYINVFMKIFLDDLQFSMTC